MKSRSAVFIGMALALAVTGAPAVAKAEEAKADVHFIDANGIGKEAGKVIFKDTEDGLEVSVKLKGIPAGNHGFHVHANGSCEPGEQNGVKVAGLAAGGHFDPKNTGKHMGPGKGGHEGDLPFLNADASGNVDSVSLVPGLTAKEIRGRSVIIHAGGDNYSDTPVPLGGGGARIACGLIK